VTRTDTFEQFSSVGTIIAERTYPEVDPDSCTICTACTGEVRSCTRPRLGLLGCPPKSFRSGSVIGYMPHQQFFLTLVGFLFLTKVFPSAHVFPLMKIPPAAHVVVLSEVIPFA